MVTASRTDPPAAPPEGTISVPVGCVAGPLVWPIGIAIGVLILMAYSALVAVVLSFYWRWFVGPAFHLPEPRPAHLIGLVMAVRVLCLRLPVNGEPVTVPGTKRSRAARLMMTLVALGAALLAGYGVHQLGLYFN